MKPTITSPDISDIETLLKIYLTLPERDIEVTSIDSFYTFLQQNSAQRQEFLETYCLYEFIPVGSSVILKLTPKDDQ